MKIQISSLLSLLLLAFSCPAVAQTNLDWQKYVPLIQRTLSQDYKKMFREKGGALQYPFIVPGSAQYHDVLWDWDSWLTNIALRQILLETALPAPVQSQVRQTMLPLSEESAVVPDSSRISRSVGSLFYPQPGPVPGKRILSC